MSNQQNDKSFSWSHDLYYIILEHTEAAKPGGLQLPSRYRLEVRGREEKYDGPVAVTRATLTEQSASSLLQFLEKLDQPGSVLRWWTEEWAEELQPGAVLEVKRDGPGLLWKSQRDAASVTLALNPAQVEDLRKAAASKTKSDFIKESDDFWKGMVGPSDGFLWRHEDFGLLAYQPRVADTSYAVVFAGQQHRPERKFVSFIEELRESDFEDLLFQLMHLSENHSGVVWRSGNGRFKVSYADTLLAVYSGAARILVRMEVDTLVSLRESIIAHFRPRLKGRIGKNPGGADLKIYQTLAWAVAEKDHSARDIAAQPQWFVGRTKDSLVRTSEDGKESVTAWSQHNNYSHMLVRYNGLFYIRFLGVEPATQKHAELPEIGISLRGLKTLANAMNQLEEGKDLPPGFCNFPMEFGAYLRVLVLSREPLLQLCFAIKREEGEASATFQLTPDDVRSLSNFFRTYLPVWEAEHSKQVVEKTAVQLAAERAQEDTAIEAARDSLLRSQKENPAEAVPEPAKIEAFDATEFLTAEVKDLPPASWERRINKITVRPSKNRFTVQIFGTRSGNPYGHPVSEICSLPEVSLTLQDLQNLKKFINHIEGRDNFAQETREWTAAVNSEMSIHGTFQVADGLFWLYFQISSSTPADALPLRVACSVLAHELHDLSEFLHYQLQIWDGTASGKSVAALPENPVKSDTVDPEVAPDFVVASQYFHLSNGGATFRVLSTGSGPVLEIETGSFGNIQQTARMFLTRGGLNVLGSLILSASSYPGFGPPYCCPLRPKASSDCVRHYTFADALQSAKAAKSPLELTLVEEKLAEATFSWNGDVLKLRRNEMLRIDDKGLSAVPAPAAGYAGVDEGVEAAAEELLYLDAGARANFLGDLYKVNPDFANAVREHVKSLEAVAKEKSPPAPGK